jgi:hypothetical protein
VDNNCRELYVEGFKRYMLLIKPDLDPEFLEREANERADAAMACDSWMAEMAQKEITEREVRRALEQATEAKAKVDAVRASIPHLKLGRADRVKLQSIVEG